MFMKLIVTFSKVDSMSSSKYSVNTNYLTIIDHTHYEQLITLSKIHVSFTISLFLPKFELDIILYLMYYVNPSNNSSIKSLSTN